MEAALTEETLFNKINTLSLTEDAAKSVLIFTGPTQ